MRPAERDRKLAEGARRTAEGGRRLAEGRRHLAERGWRYSTGRGGVSVRAFDAGDPVVDGAWHAGNGFPGVKLPALAAPPIHAAFQSVRVSVGDDDAAA